ncbi:alpha-N-arabinofuranosidase [Kribbella sp. CA-293567]|uniref:alpha-N-arabinofuranosidase n=1 Tax=Kribbella sp. CA-293567 TaxID=3002436 RepID=UPI0022DE4422|nr:alpha-L-arabinofuranosidase C-terminal domain-containing protein [Kribbella sp. CA-293567]WBQ03471.1 alpha-N-arabinofuranosidase [Kribbella sp. CA-293567]
MSPQPAARAIVDLDLEGPVISRQLYGHFAEHLGRCIYDGFYVGEDSEIPNEGGIRLDVVEALRRLNIPNLRWPGGCFADEYHWRDGIGPRGSRPSMVNSHWGKVVENNHFGTHDFLALCELLGADPYVNGNVGSGTVREMSDWIEYLTGSKDSPMGRLRTENGREEPWRVPFWGIGNEAWGCGGNLRAEAYADLARQFATYCRDHGDNRLYRIAAGANNDDYAWTETLMKAISSLGSTSEPRGYYQGISVHYYTTSGHWDRKGSATEFDTEQYYRTMIAARRIDQLLAGHSAVMDCYDPGKKVGLVLDEWGTWWDVAPGTNPGFLHQQNTLRDALVASVHFDVFHRRADRLVMANIAQTVNVLQAMLLTDEDRLVLTPTYHVFEMNKGHQDAASLAVHLRTSGTSVQVGEEELDTLSMSASVKDGTVLFSVTNLDADRPVALTLDLRGGRLAGPAARILTADAPQRHNTVTGTAVEAKPFDALTQTPGGLELELPPHSFVTISGRLVE